MRYFSVCSGIEAATVAWEPLGWEAVAFSEIDNKMPDKHGIGKADAREGKDVAHRKALDKGGSNKHGVYITTAAKNRSFRRDSKGNLVSETSKKERKK